MQELYFTSQYREFLVKNKNISSRLKSISSMSFLYSEWQNFHVEKLGQIILNEALEFTPSEVEFLSLQLPALIPYITPINSMFIEFESEHETNQSQWTQKWRIYNDGKVESEVYLEDLDNGYVVSEWMEVSTSMFVLTMESVEWKIPNWVKVFINNTAISLKPYLNRDVLCKGITGLPDPGKIWRENETWCISAVDRGNIAILTGRSESQVKQAYDKLMRR